jgi:hypothetical protein
VCACVSVTPAARRGGDAARSIDAGRPGGAWPAREQARRGSARLAHRTAAAPRPLRRAPRARPRRRGLRQQRARPARPNAAQHNAMARPVERIDGTRWDEALRIAKRLPYCELHLHLDGSCVPAGRWLHSRCCAAQGLLCMPRRCAATPRPLACAGALRRCRAGAARKRASALRWCHAALQRCRASLFRRASVADTRFCAA